MCQLLADYCLSLPSALGRLRHYLADFYSTVGRPSIDPELIIGMLIVGNCYGIRLERRLCEEAHLNLVYCWFCRLQYGADAGLDNGGKRHRAACVGVGQNRTQNDSFSSNDFHPRYRSL